jgi:hypothetical protein
MNPFALAYLLARMGFPWMAFGMILTNENPFYFVPHLDTKHGTQAANEQGEPTRA